MKNLFLLALMALVGFSACDKECEGTDCDGTAAETKTFTVSSNTADIDGSADDAELNAKVTFTNTSTSTENISVVWGLENSNLPIGWAVAVCDNETCHSPTVTDRTMTVMPDETFEFKLSFYPDGNSGTGTADIRMYVEGDQENTEQIITFSATGTK